MLLLRRSRVPTRETPIGDLLYSVLGGEPMPTWNRNRGHVTMKRGPRGGVRRHPGGEWDYIRSLPIKTRRRLTAAGFMARGGMQPDDFAGLIRLRAPGMGGSGDTDCHAWFVRHALLALTERRRAEHHDRHLAYARAQGAPTYYSLRNSEAYLDGYDSLWHKRKAAITHEEASDHRSVA